MPPQIVASDEAVDKVTCDALVVAAYNTTDGYLLSEHASAVDSAFDGRLSEFLSESNFKAAVGDVQILPTLGRIPAKTVAILGLGPRERVGRSEIMRAAGVAARRLSQRAVIASALHAGANGDGVVAGAAEGYLLGCYRFTSYKSDPKPSKIERILFLGGAQSDDLDRGAATAEATALARDLTNEPPSALFPETLANRAREVADIAGLEFEVLDENALSERGFGGLMGVGGGSHRPPRLIVMRYRPQDAKGTLALIGKGITFDSGGLSLKDAKNMETMKTDMAGGAAVIGAMSALGKLKPPVEVLGLVAAAENMPSGTAIKPGDVIKHYGGVTSEVLNTDAEGRLVLGDAIAYACEQGAEAIVDVATLTGAIMVALGRKSTGLFSNDDALRDEIEEAAERAGERVWRMPLYDDYRSDLDSEAADIKNTGGRYGGAIYAALFLKEFVPDGVAWAHLDIAGPARAESDHDEVLKGGTGVATRTLLAWVEGRAR